MTGHLALCGDRPFQESCTHEADLLAASGASEVVVLPTAAAYEGPREVVAAARARFEALGASVAGMGVIARSDALEQNRVDRVAGARFLWLCGDSPMHLRSVLKETPMWDAIVHAFDEGAVVAASGGSAMALCEPMVDPRGGAFTVGLGLVSNLAVVAQSGWSADQARRTVHLAPAGTPVVSIDATAALVRRPDGTWERSGTGEVLVYVDRAERGLDAIEPGARA